MGCSEGRMQRRIHAFIAISFAAFMLISCWLIVSTGEQQYLSGDINKELTIKRDIANNYRQQVHNLSVLGLTPEESAIAFALEQLSRLEHDIKTLEHILASATDVRR